MPVRSPLRMRLVAHCIVNDEAMRMAVAMAGTGKSWRMYS